MSNKYISTAMGTIGSSNSNVTIFSCKEMITWIKSVNIASFRVETDDTQDYGVYVDFIPKTGGKALTNYIYTNNKSLVKHLNKARKQFINCI